MERRKTLADDDGWYCSYAGCDDATTLAADETESVSNFESESNHEAAIERKQGRRCIRRPTGGAKAGGEKTGVIGEARESIVTTVGQPGEGGARVHVVFVAPRVHTFINSEY